jgi:hypothetical protein
LEYKTGRPSGEENRCTPEPLRAAFADWRIVQTTQCDAHITEGSGHRGRSALIGMMASKP